MRRFQSVKLRLTLWYAFVLTVLLSLFAFLMYAEFARALYRDTDKNLFYQALEVEQSLRRYWEKMNPSAKAGRLDLKPASSLETVSRLQEVLEKWKRENRLLGRSNLMIRLEAMDHKRLLSNLGGWQREIIFPDFERDSFFMEKGESFQIIHFQNQPFRLYYRLVRFRTEPVLVIQTADSVQEIKRALQRLGFIILISIPGAVGAACMIGWFFMKRAFCPLDSIVRKAREITGDHLEGRLPRTYAGDELDRLAETLNEMMDRLELSTRAIQDFSSNISHELKTPLAIIRGEIDLALRKTRSNEELIQTLGVIEGEVNELIRLVDDLMLLVKSDAKQIHFEKRKVALTDILRPVAERFRERIQTRKIDFALNFIDTPEVEGDEVYLKRLFSNLLDNAIKFTSEGGRIGIELKKSSRNAYIKISDNGIGIEPQMLTKVFSRFYRTDQARAHEGAGLGLNIAKTICEAHQGIIEVESALGAGTTVTVCLPLQH